MGANQLLRAKLDAALKPLKARAYFPPLHLCTDNGAMIAFAAAERVKAGLAVLDPDAHSFTVKPRWDLADRRLRGSPSGLTSWTCRRRCGFRCPGSGA